MQQIKRTTSHRKLKKVAILVGLKDYQAYNHIQLLEKLQDLLNTDPSAAALIKSNVKFYDCRGANYDYVKKSDPDFTANYTYEVLSVGDIKELEKLIRKTTKRCADPNRSVYRRRDLVSFIGNKLDDPTYNIKYFNSAVFLMANILKHRKLSINAVTSMNFLLPQKETYIIIDRILASELLREEAEQTYFKRSKKGRIHKLGDPYIKSYIKHSENGTLHLFFWEIGFRKTEFFFTTYLKRCEEVNQIPYYLNLCRLWEAYLKDHLHLEYERKQINLESIKELYPNYNAHVPLFKDIFDPAVT